MGKSGNGLRPDRNGAAAAAGIALVLRTSPGSYQAWVALAGTADAGFTRRLRQGAGADVSASGATCVRGSRNLKEKYAPGFPTVETVRARPGLAAGRASGRRQRLFLPQ